MVIFGYVLYCLSLILYLFFVSITGLLAQHHTFNFNLNFYNLKHDYGMRKYTRSEVRK